jgi:hypothetical protein
MLDAPRADAVAESLGLELSAVPACPLCLWSVGSALEDDPAELRSALRFFAPVLWDEGLEAPVRAALEAARALGIPDADAATAEVEQLGPSSRVVKAVVQRLAAQQLEELRTAKAPNGTALRAPLPGGNGVLLVSGSLPGRAGADLRSQALEYARNLGVNFPFLRPSGEASERFADRVAADLVGVDGEVPPERVAEGVALVDADERRRLVEAYVRRFPDVWDALCRDVGRETAEHGLVESAVRASVNERREPPFSLLRPLEGPRAPADPVHALASALFCEDVWTLDDAVAAAAAAGGFESLSAAWEGAIAEVARARLEPWHVERVRTLSARLAAHLPFEELPRASEALARACGLVAAAGDVAADVAQALLRNYVGFLVGRPRPRSPNGST